MKPREEGEAFGWGSLAEAGVFTLVLAGVATMVFVIRGFDPALAVDLVAMLVGLALVNRDRRSGAIVLLVGIIVFLAFGGFFALQVLSVPQSTIYFVLSAIYVVAGAATLVAAVALLRVGRIPSQAARSVAVVSSAVVMVVAGIAVSVRLAYDDPEPGPASERLVAEDNEFRPDRIEISASSPRLVVENKDLSLHTFSIESLDLRVDLPGGLSTAVDLEAEPGTYRYFCEIFGHDDMKGTLLIR